MIETTETGTFETVKLRQLQKGDTFSVKLHGQYAWGDKVIQGVLVGGYTVVGNATKWHIVIQLETGKRITRQIHPNHPVRRYI
jgi:hypothetical protein